MSHYDDVIMSTIASRTTSLTTVYLIVYSRADQRKHQSSASLAFVRGIHRRPVISPHKGPVTRKIVPFDDVIMKFGHQIAKAVGLFEYKRHNLPNLHVMLTHCDRDKIAAIFQMTYSNTFSWMKMYEFQLRFYWSLFLRVQLTIMA